jgi:U3 small nucleolar RNA-associated protein 11
MRYAERELEMQKLLMGKGGSRKLRGVEEVKDDEDEDNKKKTYKPRVYKWRPERKR